MDKVVVIGANSFQNPLILKAKELGYETHVFAWKEGAVGEKTADYFYPISIVEKDKILKMCEEIKPAAVVTIASDLAAITANYVAHKLGLTANSPQCVFKTTNKFAMRQALKEQGISTPCFSLADENSDIQSFSEMTFPVIVKPTDRSGSRSITKVMRADDLKPAIRQAVHDSFEKKAIVEEFIEGDEYSMESISFEGIHHFLALTKKYTTGSPHFIESGHLQPAGLEPNVEKKIADVIFKALDALEIKNGAAHSEFRLDKDGNVNIIEIGARMGGDCIGSHLVCLSTGYDFVRMVLEVGLGVAPNFQKLCTPKAACIRFVMDWEDMKKYETHKKQFGERFVFESPMVEPGSHSVVDSSSRYGYYITMWDSIEDAKRFMSDGKNKVEKTIG